MSEQNIERAQTQEEKKYPAGVSAKFAGGTLLASLPFDLFAHLGATGLLVGGLASYVAFRHGPEIYEGMRDIVPVLPALPDGNETASGQKKTGRSVMDRAMGRFPEGDFDSKDNQTQGPSPTDTDLFAEPEQRTEVPGIRRITIEEMVTHTTRNSYDVYIGRSLTRSGNKPVKINFYKRHIKLIGASQHGKSSMAGALIEAIMRTHDPEKVMFALLDLENKTSRLFAESDHIAEIRIDGKYIPLHARNPQEVLQHLEYLLKLVEYRYGLSEQEIDELPLLIAYLEEFLELKDFFKLCILEAQNKEQEEAAKKDYERLLHCIRKIARMGLKVHVQLLMCAQVDYADEDLKEALANVTSGMAFCVKPSAARAAGFLQEALMARNAKDDQIGQCVVEMPDCKDLILAPEYPLRDKLKALSAKDRVYKKAAPVNLETPVSRVVNSPVNASASPLEGLPDNPRLRLLETGNTPEIELESTEASTVNVNAETRETINRMVAMGIPHRQIAKAFKLDGRNYPIYKQVCKELGLAMEKEA